MKLWGLAIVVAITACGGSPPPARPVHNATPPEAEPAMQQPPSAMVNGVPRACVEYVAAIEKLAQCPAFPQSAKDGMKQGADAMMQAFAGFKGLRPDQLKVALDAANEGCKAAVDAVHQSATAAGC